MKVRGRREHQEQRAESREKMCDDGGEVQGSRVKFESSPSNKELVGGRYGGRLEACEECKSQGPGGPSARPKSERTVCQMPIAERMDCSELPLLYQRET
jgi:hypothetical protein